MTMLRPSARIAKVAQMMSTAVPGHGMNGNAASSDRKTNGYTIARTRMIPTSVRSRRRRSIPANGFGRLGRRTRTAEVMSRALGLLLGQDAGRTEDEDQDEDPEHDHGRPLRLEIAVRQRGDQPEDEPPQRGAGQVPDAAYHGCRERQQPELEPELEEGLPVVQGHDQAGCTSQRPGDQECQRDRTVDVDAHEA